MFKSSLVITFCFVLFQFGMAVEPGSIGTTPFNGHRGEGYKIVDTGSITHCGTNPGQQCFQVTPLTDVSITSPPADPGVERSSTFTKKPQSDPLDISCQPDGLCVLPFDFSQTGNYADFLVNCLNAQGEDQGNFVHVILGQGSVASTASAYSYFVAQGIDVKAKWENDDDFTSNVSLTF